jgi:conjugal transfer pilus assembly protein TraB
MINQNNTKKQFATKLFALLRMCKQHPIISSALIGLVFILFLIGANSDNVTPHELVVSAVPFEKTDNQMVGIKESVDSRDVWTTTIVQKVEATSDDFSSKIAIVKEEQSKAMIEINAQVQELKALLAKQQEKIEIKELEDGLRLSNTPDTQIILEGRPKKRVKTLGHYHREYKNKKMVIEDYVPAGAIAKAVIVQGVVVGTGNNSQSNPEPILLRLTDAGLFSKGKRTEQIKEAMLIGDCSGDLSSERARCRLQTLSLENFKGEIITRSIKGWVAGEDGKNGIKGFVVDKSSDMLRMAMLNGVLGGMSSFLQNQSTAGVFPVSPITGQQNALGGMGQLKGGMANGAGNAFSKMADFVMERFDSMSPQIVIASDREVAVVFQEGIDLSGEQILEKEQTSDGNLGGSYNNPPVAKTAQAEAWGNTMKGLEKENGGSSERAVF